MIRDITCIVCPRGCRMKVSNINGEFTVEGNSCKRGAKYGVDEVTSPTRVITSTVKLEGSYLNMLPVKTESSIPKEKMFEVMTILSNITVNAPVSVGDIIVENILNTGVNVVGCKTMESKYVVIDEENMEQAL